MGESRMRNVSWVVFLASKYNVINDRVYLRNNSPMSCFMIILTRGGIIFVDILHRAKAMCKSYINIMPNDVKMSIKHDIGELLRF